MIVNAEVSLGNTAIPYVSALDGALRAGGLWEGETWMLAGFTGLAFHLVVDPKTCPSSPTAYSWETVHSEAASRIGVASRCVECIGDEGALPARRAESLAMIKGSLDQGIPAVVRTVDWAEFAIVVGYDDEDGVLFFDDRHADPVLYANFGTPEGSPFLFAQTFREGRGLDLPAAAVSSLEYAVLCWRGKDFPKHPWYDFAYGADAYAALIDAVESGATDPLGLRYILKIHADARRSVARYLQNLDAEAVVPHISSTAAVYGEVAPLVERVAELLPCTPPFERPVDQVAAKEAAHLLREAADREEVGISQLEATLA